MEQIRIVVGCTKNENHAKVLMLDGGCGMGRAQVLADLLDGSSHFYIYPPGEGSPIGRCALCGGKLATQVTTVFQEEVKKEAEEDVLKTALQS